MPGAKAILGATALATAAAVFVVPPAAAEPQVDVIKRNLGMPLQVQGIPGFGGDTGGAIVNDVLDPEGTESRLLFVDDTGTTEEFVREQGLIAGHDFRFEGDGVVAYTLASQNGTELKVTAPSAARGGFRAQAARGFATVTLADLGAYEETNNPDGDQAYGIKRLGNCDVPRIFRPYKGIVESNPYAVEGVADGWLVADAAANAILHVSDSGQVRTEAVLPVQHIRISRRVAKEFGLPRCAVGKTMRYEPVPTDVQQAANGKIFVTLLPGGEGPTAVRGKLVRINPDNGRARTYAKGFVGATNLALAPGRIFVAELFGGQITEVDRKSRDRSLYSAQNAPASVDWVQGALYATTRVFKPAGGKLIKLTQTP